MNRNHVVRFMLPLLALALTAFVPIAYAGGWAIITLNEFPDYAVAGKTLNLSFFVRQHGVTLLPDLRPTVHATAAGGLVAKASAVPAGSRLAHPQRRHAPGRDEHAQRHR